MFFGVVFVLYFLCDYFVVFVWRPIYANCVGFWGVNKRGKMQVCEYQCNRNHTLQQ